MDCIQIGSMIISIPTAQAPTLACTIAKPTSTTPTQADLKMVGFHSKEPKRVVPTTPALIKKALFKKAEVEKSALDKWAETYEAANHRKDEKIVTTRRGVTRFVRKNRKDLRRERDELAATAREKLAQEIRLLKIKRNENQLKNNHVSIVSSISIGGAPRSASEEETTPVQKWGLNKTASSKTCKKQTHLVVSSGEFRRLLRSLAQIVREKSSTIEIVEKSTVRARSKVFKGRQRMFVDVLHQKGTYRSFDVKMSPWTERLFGYIFKHFERGPTIHHTEIQPGCSGLVVRRDSLADCISGNHTKFFIVRGRIKNILCDARAYIPYSSLFDVHHYTSPGEKFWKGFTEVFQELKPTQIRHDCTSDLDVVKCGEVSALVCQTVFPCGKITCNKCVENYTLVGEESKKAQIQQSLERIEKDLAHKYADFPHVHEILKVFGNSLLVPNKNYKAFADIKHMIGERTEAPFSHINKLNEIIIKGGTSTTSDYFDASSALLEVARYLKNRTENIQKGSLASFRNKASAKAHVNTILLCDNQLDKNGNFVWGKRGYHAKRFFKNYFELVNPSNGYAKHIIRNGPSGERQLAIGHLVMSTNFQTLRLQLEGNQVEKFPVTKACISKRNENFIYPCCCVTTETGEPLESPLYTPTKGHLVVGNTGDAKYIDLPEQENERLYISQEGFCYVNIFLAMLVNVNEDDAKNFTKIVRDDVVRKLGKWPTLIDLATACYYLTMFFPETRNAELPRILVDHKHNTMHVIDAYGSKDTGYHVLKAGTIAQLILFASESLESKIKEYRVGGLVEDTAIVQTGIKTLIRAIYRPKMFKELLLTEPYLITLSVLSPGVLLAMYNNGSFEQATQKFITQNDSLATISTTLALLATKVSLAQTLNEQCNIIDAHAQLLLQAIGEGQSEISHTKRLAKEALQVMIAQTENNASLLDGGYFVLRESSKHFTEKKYLRLLEESWEELNLLEKYYAVRASYSWRRVIQRPLNPTKGADLKGRYDISINALLKKASEAMNEIVRKNLAKGELAYKNVTKKGLELSYSACRYLIPDFMRAVSILTVLSLFVSLIAALNNMLVAHKRLKMENHVFEQQMVDRNLSKLYKSLKRNIKGNPSLEEFRDFVGERNPELVKKIDSDEFDLEGVQHQHKSKSQDTLQKIVAFVALIMMTFDADRSDCVYKILNKLKGIIGTIEYEVQHQAIDDIKLGLEEQNTKIDFEVSTDPQLDKTFSEPTFSDWWSNQLTNNNVIPHYRTEGFFMEFTRQSAIEVSNQIAHGPHMDILLRGAVGSGKSTGLPYHLSKRGQVLLLEPTRPLAENVCTQLRGDPFHTNPTLRMRGMTSFGSAPITVMTSGYALHYLANNPHLLRDYNYIIFDECHVSDSSAMAFRCLLHEYSFNGKIIKVSATPQGREVEFKTQFPVTLITEEHLSFSQFCEAQRTNAKCDVATSGENILVYVASYNEVDQLSRMLVERRFKVTKVDGRTMKVGKVAIETHGCAGAPHFIVATNIIENGVTLDVDTVVDFGQKISPTLDVDNRCIHYSKHCVTYGERIQRLGRVGRHKQGKALRIGFTEKGQVAIPDIVATEAAFLCFTYGLPVMTHNVSVSLLSKCTVKQARTMHLFELPAFYTVNLVRYDGSMHKAIHDLLKPYRLRDSEIILNKMAIPTHGLTTWMKAIDYNKLGKKLELEAETRIPFYARDIPEMLHRRIYEAMLKFKGDAGFGRISTASACKIAYTLQTDLQSIPRTVKLIDMLIEKEQQKHAHYQLAISTSCSSFSYSLSTLSDIVRRTYQKDHSLENISILQAAKAQILSFNTISEDFSYAEQNTSYICESILEHTATECIYHQSESELAKHLKLKGYWNKSLITRDIIIMLGVIGGGCWMAYSYFTEKFSEEVSHEGWNRRQRQKLKFRNARDEKLGREVYGDDGTLEHFFGEAYTKKGKTKGKTRGAGTKTRRFINMYGYDPADYSFVRFVDPLTGRTIDDSPYTDIGLIQDHFADVRDEMIANDELDKQRLHLGNANRIEAYFVNNATKKALKVDMTPHNPLLFCKSGTAIAGFPEREGEFRQTGAATPIDIEKVPKQSETSVVTHEGKALFGGLRDYNGIASVICQLSNESDGHVETMFGVGYGPFIVTNQHLFKRNNGKLTIRSRSGKFIIEDTTVIDMFPCKSFDILIMRLPKDFPPFPQRLNFRQPQSGEQICMVGSNFQEKSITSVISATSETVPFPNSHFWKHWITTKNGYCGLPLVAVKDGNIVGLHSLANFAQTQNYFANFPENFQESILDSTESLNWVQRWKYNSREICWGKLKMHESVPDGLFKIHKLISDLSNADVFQQSQQRKWMYEALKDNLQAIAQTPNQLVTKHSVKGKCRLFDLYLRQNEEANTYFQPLMGAYQKSVLSREAYIKDIMKYSTPIIIGKVDCDAFETVVDFFIIQLRGFGIETCNYITCHEDIFNSLNMKAAVGALYTGKKRDYFKEFTEGDKEEILKQSCFRLFSGKFGVWNGSLKSELRAREKVEEGKTRTFTAAPLDSLLGAKSCVDDFNNQFYDLNLKAPWSVGMTKFYCGWDNLLSGFPEGWIYCDADGSRFDSSLSPYLINSVLQIRLSFMEEWEIGAQMLKNLYTEIVYTPIATPDGTIVKKFKGNNSGQPSTVVDNTLMVIVSMKYSLFKLGIKLENQDSICKYYVNGDDLIIAIRPDHEYILDGLQEIFYTLGLNYEFSSRTRNKADLWFMSHQGIMREGKFIPKLEKERIVSILEWDRSDEPVHRLEAICAAMIEAWGYDELVHEIRKFYLWVLDQAPYNALALEGKAPYIAETALRKLYLNEEPSELELEAYQKAFEEEDEESEAIFEVSHQADDTVDAGTSGSGSQQSQTKEKQPREGRSTSDRDVDVGTTGTFSVPRMKAVNNKMKLPKVDGKIVLNADHLLQYKPPQLELSNTRSTHSQFKSWYEEVKGAYGMDDANMQIILNGLMVWCIENGTSPNINGNWVMMDGETQVEYPLKPIIENAKPTFRQIMAHFSDVAEAYIEMRNTTEKYMPRYGRQRNLNDYQLARYAFDFYEITSRTPNRAREAHFQMKAAALHNTKTRTFGLDGKVGTQEEDTERHTAGDVNANMHSLLGMRSM